MTDYELLDAWRAGDRAAGDELMRRHYAGVRRFFQLKIPHVADDLTQQTLLACVERHAELRPDSFRGYLFGIARRRLLDHLRQSGRAARVSFSDLPPRETDLSPSRVVAMRQEHRLLLLALDRLAPDNLVALSLFYGEGLSTAEMADALDVTVTVVTSRLSRARTRLREQIAAIEGEPRVRDTLLADVDGWTQSLFDGVRHQPLELVPT